MNIKEQIEEKVQKTIERVMKAAEYRDKEYMKELLYDLAEYSYVIGCKENIRNEKNPVVQKSNDVTIPTIDRIVSSIIFNLGIPAQSKDTYI